MINTAVKMCAALIAVGILASVIAGNPLPLVVVGLVAYVIWHVANGLGG